MQQTPDSPELLLQARDEPPRRMTERGDQDETGSSTEQAGRERGALELRADGRPDQGDDDYGEPDADEHDESDEDLDDDLDDDDDDDFDADEDDEDDDD